MAGVGNQSLIPPYIQTNNNSLSYGLGGEVPPEIALEEQALNRKQQIANLLFQRGMQSPQGQMVGRFYVAPNPMQGVAQLANVLAGGYITHRNDEARKGLAEKNRSMTADAIQAYIQKTSPQPVTQELEGPGAPVQKDLMEVDPFIQQVNATAQPSLQWDQQTIIDQGKNGMGTIERSAEENAAAQIQQERMQRGPGFFKEGPRPTATTMQPPTAESRRQALIEAMTSQIPGLRQFATLQSQQDMAQQEHAANRAATAQEHALTREAGAQERALNREFQAGENEKNRDVKREAMEANLSQMVMLKLMTQEQADGIRAKMDEQQALNRQNALEIAKIGAAAKTDTAHIRADASLEKPMPASATARQQEDLELIGSVSGINADLSAIEQQIDSGKLQLGMTDNLLSRGKNYLGVSDENSRNFASFKATLEKQRNESLRLNKGVQTEGDAVRAWNELMENLNDPQVVKQRLTEIRGINERAVGIRKLSVDTRRNEFGKGAFDFTPYESQPAAIGQGGSGALSKEEQSELERLRKKYGR